MHRSKLRGFIIDCESTDLGAAAGFWSEALGMRSRKLPPPQADRYIELLDPSDALHIEVQAVSHASRVHLDIETDDIDAEVRRLEGLGARRIEQVRTWWVMEAPTGQRFCVVARASADFDERASIWP